MTRSAVIAGPASPRVLAEWLDRGDQDRALALPGLGGSPVNNLVHALLETGASVELVTLAPEIDERIVLEGPGLRILIGPFRRRALHRCRDVFRSERMHVQELIGQTSGSVVHAFWTYEFALGALAEPTRPTLVTAQDAPLTILRHMPDLYRLLRTAMAVTTRFRRLRLVANSPYLAAAWRRQMLYRGEIPVIPNVVVPFANGLRSTGLTEDGAPLILDVSGAGRLKNVEALVRAMPRVLGDCPGARLRLLGSGLGQDSPLAALATRLEVDHAVDFLGPGDMGAVGRAHLGATLFVHPSREESFGMSIAEAMSSGLPIVGCARAGAVPWLLDSGRAGVLVDARRPANLATAIGRLLGDRSHRLALGAAARARAASMFSAQAVAASTLQLYEDVAGGIP